jgi:hypothetical protein
MADDSGLFPQHPKVGDWNSLKGSMLAPHEEPPIYSTAMGDTRHQTDAMAQSWDSTVVVTTGLTGGGGTMAK